MTFEKVRIAAENWAEDYMTKHGRRFHNMLKDAFIAGFVKSAYEQSNKIIHCKDCRYACIEKDRESDEVYCSEMDFYPSDDFFCGYAKQ